MNGHQADAVFAGSVPEFYERYLVPLIFEPYADDMAARLAGWEPRDVLEVAAGTGVVTRAMASALDPGVSIVATDLNQAMLDHAAQVGTVRPVVWRAADVGALPFADRSFDVVVCQFSVMFFPNRSQAFAEIRRVLRPGGRFVFSVWDRIENNDFANVVTDALGELFPADPPRFLARTPHGHYDEGPIRADIIDAGFAGPMTFDVAQHRSRAEHCSLPAIAYCQGTPLRAEIEARRVGGLEAATLHAERQLAAQFGETDLDGRTRAFVVTACTA